MAEQLGGPETCNGEYIALTQLQADAFVTLDTALASQVGEASSHATIEAPRAA